LIRNAISDYIKHLIVIFLHFIKNFVITKTRNLESTKFLFALFRVFPAAAGCFRD